MASTAMNTQQPEEIYDRNTMSPEGSEFFSQEYMAATYKCRYCIKPKKTTVDLRAHCPYSTNDKRDFERHEAQHRRERNFKCEFCPKTFGQKPHLIKHVEKDHLGVREKCRFCDYTCTEQIRRHEQKAHPAEHKAAKEVEDKQAKGARAAKRKQLKNKRVDSANPSPQAQVPTLASAPPAPAPPALQADSDLFSAPWLQTMADLPPLYTAAPVPAAINADGNLPSTLQFPTVADSGLFDSFTIGELLPSVDQEGIEHEARYMGAALDGEFSVGWMNFDCSFPRGM
ncbi:Zinc finger protein plag1 [Coniosporium tulheliwenetii]|uniref:Zinc finger protein plag1 n=1 Tax=Coniosporium tulheliwenetii TaxID=3383036 RepID=A0ACC2YIS6_9PEZI|nr:Zinc finger protein plag1 [Cladosporium sp. JES 115]